MNMMHLTARQEIDPEVIVPRPENLSDIKFGTEHVTGKWWRVFPRNGRDVALLAMLEHHYDKYAPADGDGVLISNRALDTILTSRCN
jgi:hypothetical protein